MAKLKFNDKDFLLNEHESVLECLLRNQQAIPYACKAGTCQACLIKTVDCEATDESKKWIKKTLQAQGYTLACQWVPNDDVEARLPTVDEFSVKVSIKKLEYLNPRTLRVILDVADASEMFHYYPGQYLNFINPNGIVRSYSIANNYEVDGHIELHISETLKGVFTGWLFKEAKTGDAVHVRGAAGDCFYTNQEKEDYPIVLAGTGTGLAPLYGILNEALRQGHQGAITLFQGGRTSKHLYYVQALLALQEQYPQFHYYPSAIEETDPNEGVLEGDIQSIIESKLDLTKMAQSRFFLCGNPDLVHSLRKKVFLKGAKSSNIFCDPFIERNLGLKET